LYNGALVIVSEGQSNKVGLSNLPCLADRG